MKKTLSMITVLVLAASIATHVTAKTEKKKTPKNTRAVEEALKAAGEKHFPERMKVSKVGPVQVGDTFYHIYSGRLKKLGYHIIIFDNYESYLGYYQSDFEPVNYEKGAILLDSGESDEEGNTEFYNLPIGAKGPVPKIRIGGMPATFVKAQQKVVQATQEKPLGDDEVQPEYREWIIIHKGKEIPVRALYIKQTSGKVYLKAEANGVTKPFALSSLSKADKAYVNQFK